MRSLFMITMTAIAIAASTGAAEADRYVAYQGVVVSYAPVRAQPYVVFDDQPGIGIHPYWQSPWQGRRYFPATGKRPRVGRLENRAQRGSYRPVESYRRVWWSSGVTVEDLPNRYRPVSRVEPPQQ